MSTEFEQLNTLFLTDGMISYIGLILVMTFLVGLVFIRRELAALTVPLAVVIGVTYLNANLGWHFIFMALAACFMVYAFASNKKD